MSRSTKRPYYKDSQTRRRNRKKIASRRFRRAVRQTLSNRAKQHVLLEEILMRYMMEWPDDSELVHLIGDDEPEFPHPKWFTNPCDICDWISYAPRDKRAYRK